MSSERNSYDNAYVRKWLADVYDPARERMMRDLYLQVAMYCNHNRLSSGSYFEFGCHRGRTMRYAWDAFHALLDFRYFAFDSFHGIPRPQGGDVISGFREGDMCTSHESFRSIVTEHGIPPECLSIVPGLYADSLSESLSVQLTNTAATVTLVDCVLYESTTVVLDFLKGFLRRGSVIIFDDWFDFFGDPAHGEQRAFREFRESDPTLKFTEFIQVGEVKCFIYLGVDDKVDRNA